MAPPCDTDRSSGRVSKLLVVIPIREVWEWMGVHIYIYFGSVLFHDIVNLTSEKIWKIPLLAFYLLIS